MKGRQFISSKSHHPYMTFVNLIQEDNKIEATQPKQESLHHQP